MRAIWRKGAARAGTCPRKTGTTARPCRRAMRRKGAAAGTCPKKTGSIVRPSRISKSCWNCRAEPAAAQMLLAADLLGLAGEGAQRRHVAGRIESEMMDVVARRDRLHLRERRIVRAPREDEVAEHPPPPHRQLGERHPRLEGDPALLGKDRHRAEALQ